MRLYFSYVISLLIAFISIALSAATMADFNLVKQWSFNINGSNNASTPALYPDEVRPTDIILAAADGILYRVNASGNEMFQYDLGEATNCSPVVGDMDADGKPEILIASINGTIHCVNSKGNLIWQFQAKSQISYSIVLADINMDGKLEIFAGTRAGWLYCINYDGVLRWKFRAEPSAGPPAVGDVNRDGIPEVVYGTDVQKMFCLDQYGRYIWHTELNGFFGRSLPIICDINGDMRTEILFSRSEVCRNPAVIAIDGSNGKILWEASTTLHGYGPFAVADINKDKVLDILVTDKATSVYCLTPDGDRKWVCELKGHGIFYPPAVTDLNTDGKFELICGMRTQGSRFKDVITILDCEGNILQTLPLAGGGNSCPTIGDLDKDGKLELYMVTQHPACLVQFEVQNTTQAGQILWSSWQGNSRRNGYVVNPFAPPKVIQKRFQGYKHEPGEEIFAFLGANELRIPLDPNYKNNTLLLETYRSAAAGDEITLDFIAAKRKHVTADYYIDNIDENKLAVTILDRKSGTRLQTISYAVQVNSFRADINHLHSLENKLDSLFQLLPDQNEQDGEFFNLIKLQVLLQQEKLKNSFSRFDTWHKENQIEFVQRIGHKRDRFNQYMNLIIFMVAQRRSGNTSPFACWEDINPWDDIPAQQLYPKSDISKLTLNIQALGNEIESRALYITNFSTETLYLKIKPLEWLDESGAKVNSEGVLEFREGIDIGTFARNTVSDALPRLNEGQVIVVPARDNRQLWLTFCTKGMKAGSYKAECVFYTLGKYYYEQGIQLNLKVSKVSLPEKSRLSFYTWAHLGSDPESPLNEKKLQDLLDHGTTVFSVSAPLMNYDHNGRLNSEINWQQHDNWILKYKDKGVILVPSFQGVIRVPQHVPMWSESWKMAYMAGLRQYVKHLKSLGFDYTDWALYPYDEPWLTGMGLAEMLYDIAVLTKETDPNIQIFTDPAGMPTPENSKKFVSLIDIWMPMIDLLKEDKSLLNFYKSSGAKVWAYEAPDQIKLLKPLGLYRLQPWLAFRYGLSGCGMWTYNYGNLWPVDQSEQQTWGIIYEDGQTLVTSRRWEAYRDGVEDYNMLVLLQEAIEEKKAEDSTSSALLHAASELLRRAVDEVTSKQEMAVSNSRINIEYDPDYYRMMQYRRQMIQTLEDLY